MCAGAGGVGDAGLAAQAQGTRSDHGASGTSPAPRSRRPGCHEVKAPQTAPGKRRHSRGRTNAAAATRRRAVGRHGLDRDRVQRRLERRHRACRNHAAPAPTDGRCRAGRPWWRADRRQHRRPGRAQPLQPSPAQRPTAAAAPYTASTARRWRPPRTRRPRAARSGSQPGSPQPGGAQRPIRGVATERSVGGCSTADRVGEASASTPATPCAG